MGTSLNNIVFVNMGINKFDFSKVYVPFLGKYRVSHFYQILRRWAPENDEDPRKQIFEILDMNFIAIKKHDIGIW